MLHFACILGATNIDIIGCELAFPNDEEHFYGDKWYSDLVGKCNPFPEFVYLDRGEKRLKTLSYFILSAKFIKECIEKIEGERIAKVNIVCDSLIKDD